MPNNFAAIDLGAESGRVILGTLDEGKLLLEELHRFSNTPVRLPTGLYWDTLRLWHEILRGLTVAGRERGIKLDGIGVATWGVDFGLLGADGALVDNPRHYRDARNNGVVEKACAVVPPAEIFAASGIQFMQINSLIQLYAMKLEGSPALETARTLLFMPDLFSYFLSGVKRAEASIASTSQFYDPAAGGWATKLVERLGLDAKILPEIVRPGAALGKILPYVADLTGLDPGTRVFATAGHDTAAAVAAVPAEGDDWCYVSSGTWSLMGVELRQPVLGEQALALNFTNEIGVEGRVRLLKNIMGLWPLQECRRAWALEGKDYSYEEITQMAASAPEFAAVIQPDEFLEPGHMPERIAAYCARTGQHAPGSHAAMARVILESLALRYRQVVENLELLSGRAIRKIHIVGGGSRNQLLNQFVADCTGRTVIAGPTEATAAGNILVQAMGAGLIANLEEIRAEVRRCFPVTETKPRPSVNWDAAYERFLKLA
ncbi:MAG: rhamnulokinase family protein [Bryobacteraceae bacterium]